jgi:lipoate-protein ligase A
MAVDETLLHAVRELGRPVLRFYAWQEPAASFGYFQKHAEVARMTRLRPLVRRPTGGGLVPHEADWTYSVAFPPEADWYSLRATDSYRALHEWIRDAFEKVGTHTELSSGSRKEAPGQCFAGAEQFDLVWCGRKIAGAAQRRARQGLLIQGSVQPPPGLARGDWEEALCEAASARWAVRWEPWSLPPELESATRHLTDVKYSLPEYNERR